MSEKMHQTTFADVIIIGGGPAGVAAALELHKQGIKDIILLERDKELGGATRHCSHSPFGMREFKRVYFGAHYGKKLQKEVEKRRIDVRFGHSVVALGDEGNLKISSYKGLENFTAKRIIVATGNRETPRSVRMVTGDRPIGILNTGALQAYIAFYQKMPFKKPIIIGSELVSFSALLTCISHGARPVAILEQSPSTIAWAPCAAFPKLLGVPFYHQAQIIDIIGKPRVQSVIVDIAGRKKQFDCDGVLFTGEFRPESSLFLRSSMGVAKGSQGAIIDQDGRCLNPIYFAAGNVLRGVETGGFAYREGQRIGANVAADLQSMPLISDNIEIEFSAPIKLVVPSILRRKASLQADSKFQLRFTNRVKGKLSLMVDGSALWSKHGQWLPERRVLLPILPAALKAARIEIKFEEEKK